MRKLAVIGFALFTGALVQPAFGQAWPAKPVRIIVSFPAGGATDFLARGLAERLQAGMQQTVLVDNRPGGNTFISAEAAAKSAPDGYTLFMAVSDTMTTYPLVYSKAPYDPERDFTPISHVASQTFFLVAGPKAPFKNLRELVAYARANPGKVSYGTSSLLPRLMGETLRIDANVELLNVPFKGLMLPALLSGDLDIGIAPVVPYDAYVRDGKLYGLATTGPSRERLLPNTPTVREAGVPEIEASNWNGLFAPAGTPAPIVARLNAEVRKALADPALIERLTLAATYPSASSPEELHAMMRSYRERWGRVIKAAGIRLD